MLTCASGQLLGTQLLTNCHYLTNIPWNRQLNTTKQLKQIKVREYRIELLQVSDTQRCWGGICGLWHYISELTFTVMFKQMEHNKVQSPPTPLSQETRVVTVKTLSRQKKIPDFFSTFIEKMQEICRTYVHILIQIFCEHHVWKMKYSTNKVQVSYFVELPQSNFPDYTNLLTFPTFPWR